LPQPHEVERLGDVVEGALVQRALRHLTQDSRPRGNGRCASLGRGSECRGISVSYWRREALRNNDTCPSETHNGYRGV
jgi:hypothetical protein